MSESNRNICLPTRPPPGNLSRGAYLLPNALTTAAIFAGFFAIISAISGNYLAGCVAIIVAGVLDGLDGRVARMTGTQSEFGTQYDSLSDMVSFGMAPAILVYTWALADLGEPGSMAEKLGWLGAFFYSACAALRLARFNTQSGVADKRYFQGLASPAAAGTLVATIWLCLSRDVAPDTVQWVLLGQIIILGILMFSGIRYFSFKTALESDRVPIARLVVVLVLIILLAIDLPAVLFGLGVAYTLSGPILTIHGRQRQRRRRRREERRAEKAEAHDDAE